MKTFVRVVGILLAAALAAGCLYYGFTGFAVFRIMGQHGDDEQTVIAALDARADALAATLAAAASDGTPTDEEIELAGASAGLVIVQLATIDGQLTVYAGATGGYSRSVLSGASPIQACYAVAVPAGRPAQRTRLDRCWPSLAALIQRVEQPRGIVPADKLDTTAADLAEEVRSGRAWYTRTAAEHGLELVGVVDAGGTVIFNVVSGSSTVTFGPPDNYLIGYRIAVSRSPGVAPTITAGPLAATVAPDARAAALAAATDAASRTVAELLAVPIDGWTADGINRPYGYGNGYLTRWAVADRTVTLHLATDGLAVCTVVTVTGLGGDTVQASDPLVEPCTFPFVQAVRNYVR